MSPETEEEKRETIKERYYRRKAEVHADKISIIEQPELVERPIEERYRFLANVFPTGITSKREMRRAIATRSGKDLLYVACPLCGKTNILTQPTYTFDPKKDKFEFTGTRRNVFHAMRKYDAKEIDTRFYIIQKRKGGGRFDHILESGKSGRGTGIGFHTFGGVTIDELVSFDPYLYDNLVREVTLLYEYVTKKRIVKPVVEPIPKPPIIPVPKPEVPEWLMGMYSRIYAILCDIIEAQDISIADAIDITRDAKTDMVFIGDIDSITTNWELIDVESQDKLCDAIAALNEEVVLEIESESWWINLSKVCIATIKLRKKELKERKRVSDIDYRMSILHYKVKGGIIVTWTDEKGIKHKFKPDYPGMELALLKKDIKMAKELLKGFIVPYLKLTEEEFNVFLDKFRRRKEEIKEAMPKESKVTIDAFLKLFKPEYREEIKPILEEILEELKEENKLKFDISAGLFYL